MARKVDLLDWVIDALGHLGGKSRIAPICKHIWDNHEVELRESGDLFYVWQYEMRWAATTLRRNGKLLGAKQTPRGVWQLS